MADATKQSNKGKNADAAKPNFFAGVASEWKKISWPSKKDLVKQTIAVMSASVVLGVLIAVLDFFIQYGVSFLTK